jgi:hypothetical protein
VVLVVAHEAVAGLVGRGEAGVVGGGDDLVGDEVLLFCLGCGVGLG